MAYGSRPSGQTGPRCTTAKAHDFWHARTLEGALLTHQHRKEEKPHVEPTYYKKQDNVWNTLLPCNVGIVHALENQSEG